MKKIIDEFKKFVMRGNIVDMAVGVIVGSSFTAIVNALSNNILKPVINWLLTVLFGADSLSQVYTFLFKVTDEAGAVNLDESIYIDWGAFINAVINFFLVAVVLFTIVKIVNTLRDRQKKMLFDLISDIPTKADRKAMKKQGIKLTDDKAVKQFMYEKKQAAEKQMELEKAEAEEKARLEKINNPSTEDLLKEILEVLKNR